MFLSDVTFFQLSMANLVVPGLILSGEFFSLGSPEKYLLYSLTGLADWEAAPLTGPA